MSPNRCVKNFRLTWEELARCELLAHHRGKCGPLPKPPLAQEHSETSKAAARSVRVQDAVADRRAIKALVEARGADGMTDEEIQRALELNGNTERPRRVELVTAGYLVDGGSTRTTSSGRQAVVWVAAHVIHNQPTIVGNFVDKSPSERPVSDI